MDVNTVYAPNGRAALYRATCTSPQLQLVTCTVLLLWKRTLVGDDKGKRNLTLDGVRQADDGRLQHVVVQNAGLLQRTRRQPGQKQQLRQLHAASLRQRTP